jgi:2'-5' RNA ligase
LLLSLLISLAAASPATVATAVPAVPAATIARSLVDGAMVEFVAHQGDGQWDGYLAMNLPLEPAAETFKQLLIKERRQLTNRGEAHITVITPVEYWNVLRAKVSIQKIHEIARSSAIQRAKVDIVCLARGGAMVDGREEHAFYVVVKSADLVAIRKKIRDAFVAAGGVAKDFDPVKFYPHVTIGFTKRDLHESDGVIKDSRTCL